jgi:uncharacterized protein YggE
MLVSAVAATALVAVYLIGSAQPDGRGSAVAATEDTADAVPGIVMTGTAQVTGVPDRLGFDVAVKVPAADVSGAMAGANRVTRRVLAALEAQGVAAEDVQTTRLSINPRYDYSENDAVLVGYGVSQRMSVLARDLGRAGATMSAAVEAGGNAVRIGDVRLRVGDLDTLRADARGAAMEEARAKAEQYAARRAGARRRHVGARGDGCRDGRSVGPGLPGRLRRWAEQRSGACRHRAGGSHGVGRMGVRLSWLLTTKRPRRREPTGPFSGAGFRSGCGPAPPSRALPRSRCPWPKPPRP